MSIPESHVSLLPELRSSHERCIQPASPDTRTVPSHPVVTDLTVRTFSRSNPISELDPQIWHRLEKDLYLYASDESAWLYVALVDEGELAADDLLVVDVMVGEPPPRSSQDQPWESRPGGIWVLRSEASGGIHQAVTEVDILFGTDAVDPRPQWTLMPSPLQLDGRPDVPVPRLSVLHGRADPRPGVRPALRVRDDGKFKIVQISDTHMVTGVGVCKDAMDAQGKYLPESEADPLTVNLIGKVLDVERPDLVVLTGDQLHHDIPESQSVLFKAVAPIIERSIPFAVVFGNHDSEGVHALSRTEQMLILQNLPFSLCEPGPEHIDGIGNFCLQVLAPEPSQRSLSTLYFLDSHGKIPSKIRNPDYDPIKQSQIDWFMDTSQAHEKDNSGHRFDISLCFLHIPIPEFGDPHLSIHNGSRNEPSETPSFNSHFYDALAKRGISALSCGHDHVNDFCALLPQGPKRDGEKSPHPGPWLCYGGGSGFGGYCSYDGARFHRRARVWEVDTRVGGLNTWKRVEYAVDRVDEIMLVERGAVLDPSEEKMKPGDTY